MKSGAKSGAIPSAMPGAMPGAILSPMVSPRARRIFSCLLLMLAFQFTWSAISAYCMHETGVAAQHLGHHQHKPDAHDTQLAGADDGKPAPAKKAAHSHCASCVHAVLAPAAAAPAPCLMLARAAPASIEPTFASIVQSPPYRPQWRAAA